MTRKQLVKRYAKLVATHGVESPEARAFLAAHADNRDFTQLARLTAFLHAHLVWRWPPRQ